MDRTLRVGPRLRLMLATASGLAVAAVSTAGAITRVERPAIWDVAEMAPGGRAIDVSYAAGGCKGKARAVARETATTVTLTVRQTVTEGGVCTADFFLGSLRVRLAAPLGGRTIKGTTGRTLTSIPSGSWRRVPRLVGFSPREAKRVLRLRRMVASVRTTPGGSGLARVVAQFPAAGATVSSHATVRIRVARH